MDNEGPDQPAQMCRLIWAYVVLKLHKGPFCKITSYCIYCTPNIGTPNSLPYLHCILKSGQVYFATCWCVCETAGCVANSAEVSVLALPCLLRSACPDTKDKYGTRTWYKVFLFWSLVLPIVLICGKPWISWSYLNPKEDTCTRMIDKFWAL